ncbi:MAG: hypothetical protein M9919_10325 [Burkholderiaceae bacterium]|jgi:hypothetical protein|nr:hypothetical protein [Burkholderiaceae bacterium]
MRLVRGDSDGDATPVGSTALVRTPGSAVHAPKEKGRWKHRPFSLGEQVGDASKNAEQHQQQHNAQWDSQKPGNDGHIDLLGFQMVPL